MKIEHSENELDLSLPQFTKLYSYFTAILEINLEKYLGISDDLFNKCSHWSWSIGPIYDINFNHQFFEATLFAVPDNGDLEITVYDAAHGFDSKEFFVYLSDNLPKDGNFLYIKKYLAELQN